MSWRWRLVVDASVLLAIGSVVPTVPTADVVTAAQVLGPQGLGPVPFGVAKPNAVGGLIRVFGKPSSAGSNSGCDGRYSEVEWGELVAEFRLGVFSGYRYLTGGWPLTAPGFPHPPPSQLRGPHLATAKGISLGSTLGQLRSAYDNVHFVGVDKWKVANGLVFVVDAAREPELPSSKVVEIKFGTCGDF
jgi:hypothetical protein